MSEAEESNDFLSNILTPGSSRHPTFLAIVDGVLAALLIVLLTSAYLTRSLHFIGLSAIELGLWASVKWFVNELKNIPAMAEEENDKKEL